MGVRRRFDEEFKRGCVELAGRVGVSAAARDLGVSVGAVHRWCRDDKLRSPSGVLPSDLEKENRRLKKELRATQHAVYILKKTAGILSRGDKDDFC